MTVECQAPPESECAVAPTSPDDPSPPPGIGVGAVAIRRGHRLTQIWTYFSAQLKGQSSRTSPVTSRDLDHMLRADAGGAGASPATGKPPQCEKPYQERLDPSFHATGSNGELGCPAFGTTRPSERSRSQCPLTTHNCRWRLEMQCPLSSVDPTTVTLRGTP
jgi:hypothetical protein